MICLSIKRTSNVRLLFCIIVYTRVNVNHTDDHLHSDKSEYFHWYIFASSVGDTYRTDRVCMCFFSTGKTRPKVQGNTKLHDSLSKVESVAEDTGLPAEDIVTLVNVAASSVFRKYAEYTFVINLTHIPQMFRLN